MASAAVLAGVGMWRLTSTRKDATVPNLVGKTLEEARTLAASKNLGMEVVESRYNQVIPKGQVVFQSPAAQRFADRDRLVRVIMSLGPAATKMPELRGMHLAQTRDLLKQAGLTIDVPVRVFSSRWDRDTVIDQTPAPETSLAKGAQVCLLVSLGTYKDQIHYARFIGHDPARCGAHAARGVVEPRPRGAGAQSGAHARHHPAPGSAAL